MFRSVSKYSLRFSLGSAFVGLVVLTSFSLGLATYLVARSFVRDDIRMRLHDLAGVTALHIDGDEHDRIQERGDEQTDAYRKIKAHLQQVRSASQGIRFIYTMRRDSAGKLAFVVDAEENPQDMSHVGDVYDLVTPMMQATFGKPLTARVESEFATDKWGTWLSGYAPILGRSGDVVGIVGMDMSAQQVLDYERQCLFAIVLVCGLITVLAVLAGVLYSRSISRPLLVLADDLNRIRRFELDNTVTIRSRVVEVLEMKNASENMKSGLRSFRKYVPADLVAELIKLGKEAVLGAEKRELTLFFSDIADFTTISERLKPEELADSLRAYFEGMTAAILRNQGTVDKYIGDAIMAFWGAPHPLESHATLACRSALQCQKYLTAINRAWAEKGMPPLRTRIGLNTGEVIVGNFGYEERLNYTAMGDNVNLASRLEGLNKHYGTGILISEHTCTRAQKDIEARLIDVVAVKGKTAGIRIYELLSEKGGLDKEELEFIDRYTPGTLLYLDRSWGKAASVFEDALRLRPDDMPSQILLKRCREYAVKPPPDDWDGVIFMREK